LRAGKNRRDSRRMSDGAALEALENMGTVVGVAPSRPQDRK
jgi:hypothetical protein